MEGLQIIHQVVWGLQQVHLVLYNHASGPKKERLAQLRGGPRQK
uniref:Uncharacterized protein n=1 Tax=Solanum lycopersicum TaxID=4081 RepID=A0A3Q7IIL3_SOLLC